MTIRKSAPSKTAAKKPNLLEMASAAVPASAKFDLVKDEVVKQTLAVQLIKVLPASPTVARLFDSATISMMQIKHYGKTKIHLFEPSLADDPTLAPYVFNFQIASGRTDDGEMFLAYCRLPSAENPNRYHTSGIRAMKLALKEPVAKRPYTDSDSSYTVMRFGPGAEAPTIKEPDYSLAELLDLAFDGREVLNEKSAVIVALKSLQADD